MSLHVSWDPSGIGAALFRLPSLPAVSKSLPLYRPNTQLSPICYSYRETTNYFDQVRSRALNSLLSYLHSKEPTNTIEITVVGPIASEAQRLFLHRVASDGPSSVKEMRINFIPSLLFLDKVKQALNLDSSSREGNFVPNRSIHPTRTISCLSHSIVRNSLELSGTIDSVDIPCVEATKIFVRLRALLISLMDCGIEGEIRCFSRMQDYLSYLEHHSAPDILAALDYCRVEGFTAIPLFIHLSSRAEEDRVKNPKLYIFFLCHVRGRLTFHEYWQPVEAEEKRKYCAIQ